LTVPHGCRHRRRPADGTPRFDVTHHAGLRRYARSGADVKMAGKAGLSACGHEIVETRAA
jgi:hypothetical protein